jgi:4-hydroxybenzoyl-CoA thioesterase
VTGGRKLARHDSGPPSLLTSDGLTAAALVGDMGSSMGTNSNFICRRQFVIEWGHCDPAGIVFNARFFEFFDANTWIMFERALGLKAQAWPKAYGAFGVPLVDSSARFLAPARYGDVVEIASQVTEFRRSSFDLVHTITANGKTAVEGRETRVWVGRDPANPDKLKSQTIPPEVQAKFAAAANA